MADQLIAWIRANGVRKHVRAGEIVVRRGTVPQSVLLVDRGSVLLEGCDASGRVLPMSVHGDGALVGLSAAILNLPNDLSAISRVESALISIAASSVRDLASCQPHGLYIARSLAAESRGFAHRIAALQSHTVRERVLTVLLELSRGATAYPVTLAFPMHHLAALVGADITHVCRIMRSLHAEALVDYGKRRLSIRGPLHRPTVRG